MNAPESGSVTYLDELESLAPDARRAALASALDTLRSSLLGHQVLVGAPVPAVSERLDTEQLAVVRCAERTLRLLAPAGSGKTHCIANRVLERQRSGVPPGRMLLLTFNRAAADELRERIQSLTPGRGQPQVQTLNAFGLGVLRKHAWSGKMPRLISEHRGAQYNIVRRALEAVKAERPAAHAILPDNLKHTFYLDLFSLFKNQLISPRRAADELSYTRIATVLTPIAGGAAAPLFAQAGTDAKRLGLLMFALDRLFRLYESAKEAAGFIDYDDQKLLCYELLKSNAASREVVQGSYEDIVVDEFQDLNELDFRLILLVSQDAHLMVVGDDDQAIYGFRGTSPRYIIEFVKASGRATQSLQLRRNYRCPRNIVEHADALIRHNVYRVEKAPIAERTSFADVRVYDALTPTGEAALIGDYVTRLQQAGAKTSPLRDIAILYRMNSQSLPLQLELVKRGVPYYCRKEDNILGRDFLPRLVAVLRFIHATQTTGQPALDDFVETVRACLKFCKDADVAHLRAAARTSGAPFLAALDNPALVRAVPSVGKHKVRDAIDALLSQRDPLGAAAVIAKRCQGLKGMVGSLEDAVGNQLPLGEIGDIAAGFASIGDLATFLGDMLAKAGGLHTEEYDVDAVRLMTYFRSKGLQFGTVILPTVNAGVIPHKRAPIEDERRLFYVAVTRTTRNLWISYVRKVCNKRVKPSGFLDELRLPAGAWIGRDQSEGN